MIYGNFNSYAAPFPQNRPTIASIGHHEWLSWHHGHKGRHLRPDAGLCLGIIGLEECILEALSIPTPPSKKSTSPSQSFKVRRFSLINPVACPPQWPSKTTYNANDSKPSTLSISSYLWSCRPHVSRTTRRQHRNIIQFNFCILLHVFIYSTTSSHFFFCVSTLDFISPPPPRVYLYSISIKFLLVGFSILFRSSWRGETPPLSGLFNT